MNDRQIVAGMIAWIEKNLTAEVDARALAEHSGYSLNRLRQKFFNVTGDTPSGYLRKRKLTEASKEILAGRRIADVSLKYGYSSQDNFTTAFRSYFGIPPGELYQIDSKYKRFISRLREEFSIMEIIRLQQPPFCSTMMGCVKGTADYFDLDLSPPMLFGLSGHAFLINIHHELCPSSPYVWNHEPFLKLLRNLGINHTGDRSFDKSTPMDERRKTEAELKAHLEGGNLVMLTFLEHQLVNGFDEEGFSFLKPWQDECEVQLQRLTFGTWEEALEKEGWVMFDLLERGELKTNVLSNTREALSYALDLFRNPEAHQCEGYRVGFGAYENWITHTKKAGGDSHGNWWNGMVWKECRDMASAFFLELEELLDIPGGKELCRSLGENYRSQAARFDRIKERALDDGERIRLLEENRSAEEEAVSAMEKLMGFC